MHRLAMLFATVVFVGIAVNPAAAQEADETVAFTGCLGQEDEGDGVEYYLTELADEAVDVEEVELVAGDGVNLALHVGHVVEATGAYVADDGEVDDDGESDGDDEADEADDGKDLEDELEIRVTALKHVAASCTGR